MRTFTASAGLFSLVTFQLLAAFTRSCSLLLGGSVGVEGVDGNRAFLLVTLYNVVEVLLSFRGVAVGGHGGGRKEC